MSAHDNFNGIIYRLWDFKYNQNLQQHQRPEQQERFMLF